MIGRASNKVIEGGDLVVLGCSARYDGLTSAIGRTVVAGTATPSQKEFIEVSATAHELAQEKIAHDMPAREVDVSVRKFLDEYDLHPLYSLVHGIGWTEAMEGRGAATQHCDWDFPKNISIMLDLGIFGEPFKDIPPEKMGLRIEDPFIIDNEGQTLRLTDLPLYCEAGKEY